MKGTFKRLDYDLNKTKQTVFFCKYFVLEYFKKQYTSLCIAPLAVANIFAVEPFVMRINELANPNANKTAFLTTQGQDGLSERFD